MFNRCTFLIGPVDNSPNPDVSSRKPPKFGLAEFFPIPKANASVLLNAFTTAGPAWLNERCHILIGPGSLALSKVLVFDRAGQGARFKSAGF